MDHAVDVAGQADEQAELGDVANLALQLGAGRMGLGETLPGIGHALLEAERDAALGHVDVQHHHFDFLRGRNDLARMDVLLGPAHFADMDQALDTGLQLDERAVVGDVGDTALELERDRILGAGAFPRIAHQLLHAERNALGLGVEANDLDLDRLADGQCFGRVIDTLPGDVGDMQQAIDATQIHERTVVGDVLHDAVEHLALRQRAHQARTVLGPGLFHHGAPRHHDVAAAAIHLEDLELLGLAHQRADIAYRTDIHLAARQKRHRAAQVDREATLHAAEDRAHDALVVGECLLENGPGFLAARLVARQDGLAFLVLHAIDEDVDLVAFLHFGGAAIGEFTQCDAALGLEADIDGDEIVGDANDPALDDRAFETGRTTERFVEKCREFGARRVVLGSAQGAALSHSVPLPSSIPGEHCCPSANRLSPADPLPLKHRRPGDTPVRNHRLLSSIRRRRLTARRIESPCAR